MQSSKKSSQKSAKSEEFVSQTPIDGKSFTPHSEQEVVLIKTNDNPDSILPANSIKVGSNGLQLKTLDDMLRFATMIVNSQMAPPSLKTAEAVIIAMQFGMEIGLSPMQSIQNIAVINNVPAIYGDAAKALIIGSGECEYIRETATGSMERRDYKAVCKVKRKGGEEYVIEFTYADAIAAQLLEKPMWKKYPKRMFMFRARGFALRDVFPDILKGIKTYEEVADYEIVGESAQPSAQETGPRFSGHKKRQGNRPIDLGDED